MNRDTLEALAEPLAARFQTVMQQGLAASGLSPADISSVEVVGSSMRVPILARIVEQVFGKPPSRTLNAKEVVSRGAALQCAMLSPVFKVRNL
jgi:heat shock 70kDa protein 4